MAGRKIILDSDNESDIGNSPSPIDHEFHNPSLDTIDPRSPSTGNIIEQFELTSTSSTERLNRDLRDAHNNLLEPTPVETSLSSNTEIADTAEHEEATLNEEVQDNNTPLEDSAAASRVNSMLNDYRGPEISILSSGARLQTSVQRFAGTGKHEGAQLRGQPASPFESSSPPQTFDEQETSNSAIADELGSDDPAIGLPKDQYQPRPSRSRGNKEHGLVVPESFSKRPEALVKEKRKAKNRRKTTALERPTPRIDVDDEDEEKVKVPFVAVPKLLPRPGSRHLYNDESDREISSDRGPGQAIAVDQYSENRNGEDRAKQEAKEKEEVVPTSPSPKKRGRGRPKKQSTQPIGDIQDIESEDEACHEPNEDSTKPGLGQGGKKRKSGKDHASPEDSAEDQEADHDDDDATATDTAQSVKAPPKKRGRKKKTDLPATSAPALDQEPPTVSPKKIATPPTTPPRAVKPVHSPITSSTVKFRVGLSKRARIAPLLKIVRK